MENNKGDKAVKTVYIAGILLLVLCVYYFFLKDRADLVTIDFFAKAARHFADNSIKYLIFAGPAAVLIILVLVMKTKLLKRLLPVFLACCAVVFAVTAIDAVRLHKREAGINGMRNTFLQERYIIHAGGRITGEDGQAYDYTNSVEALENSCRNGKSRLCELDFRRTADDMIVCSHDKADSGLSLAEIMDKKSEGLFTPITLESLAEIMRKYPDIIIITDIKEDRIEICRRIRDNAPELIDRFVIQIQHEEDYEPVRELGFDYILYTLYNTEDWERTPGALKRMICRYDVVNLTFWDSWADDPAFMEPVSALGVPVFLHTVNDEETAGHYTGLGADGFYTDVLGL